MSSTVLPIVPVLSWPGAYLGNLYLVLHGQSFGVLCLFVNFLCLIGLWDFQCKAFRHTLYSLLGVSFEMWNIDLFGGNCHIK